MGKPKTAYDRILRERGLIHKQKPIGRRYSSFVPQPPPAIRKRTPLMKYLEQKYRVNIEEVLITGSLSQVAKRLGNEVDVTTISKWIKKLKLRYSANNLPDCPNCRHQGPLCQGGICILLTQLELWELVLVKREKLLEQIKREGIQNPAPSPHPLL